MKQGKLAAWLIALLVVLAVLGIAAYVSFGVLPYILAENAMPDDPYFMLTARPNGETELTWTPADRCDGYVVTVLRDGTETPLYQVGVESPQCVLPKLDTEHTLHISINTWKRFSRFGQQKLRPGPVPAELTCTLDAPGFSDLRIEPDPETKTARVFWADDGENTVLLQAEIAGEVQALGIYSADEVRLSFGETGTLRMPEHEEQYTFTASAYREGANYSFYGCQPETVRLVREDLLDRELHLACEDLGENLYCLSWAETKGSYYAVQELDSAGQWQTLAEIDRAAERSYSTGHLAPFTEHTLRVVAMGGDTLPESDCATAPEEQHITTAQRILFARVWPMAELELYADANRQTVLDKVPAGACCCVMGEENGLFQVRWRDLVGYLDSNCCMIDLPDYLGDLCAYDITNSYASLYMVHEFGIPKVTDTVVSGYENIRLPDGTYLVPLLYPTAKKLVAAAQAALADGYRLKIYDSFRPNRATRSIYDLTLKIIDEPLPEKPFTDANVKELDLPEPKDDDHPVTYQQVMTNAYFGLGSFLAAQVSFHNMGIALDLTLERAATGEELPMQTRMHDLSCYSVLARNNANAVLLSNYMRGADFAPLSSEWWHFQDDGSRNALQLSAYLWAGVSSEGWAADDGGWRYRSTDGSLRRDCIVTLGEQTFRFDADGYLSEA